MSIEELHEKPGHLIRRAHQIAVAVFAEECGQYSLTKVQYSALFAIHENPGTEASRVAGLIAFDRSTIGDVLDRLEGKGLITRKANPADRRVKSLYITDAGAELLEIAGPAVDRVQERLLRPLRREERAVFVRLLKQIVDVQNETSRAPLSLVRKT
jgi:DNA-binding MarR family transcriptional regulator